jgi:hypothetical protein
MTEVLEIEKVEQNSEVLTAVKDTWILRLPAEICRREGFAEGTMISLTLKNGAIQSSVIEYSSETEDFINQVVADEKEFFEEMRKLGD